MSLLVEKSMGGRAFSTDRCDVLVNVEMFRVREGNYFAQVITATFGIRHVARRWGVSLSKRVYQVQLITATLAQTGTSWQQHRAQAAPFPTAWRHLRITPSRTQLVATSKHSEVGRRS